MSSRGTKTVCRRGHTFIKSTAFPSCPYCVSIKDFVQEPSAEAIRVRAKVWLYPGAAAWHFVTIGKKHSEAIRQIQPMKRRGFGSRRVLVTVGATQWKTSIFPDKPSGCFILPIKAQVRKQEHISADEMITLTLVLMK